MSISRAADLYYTYRFIKTLVTDWKDMDAYELGMIDDNGKNLIRAKDLTTAEQRNAFTTFHRLVFNIKRIMEKVPFGRSKIASYAAALYLLREETGMSENAIIKALDELGVDTSTDLSESNELTEWPGAYILSEDVNEDHPKGSIINLGNVVDTFAGIAIYNTQENIFVTKQNIS